MEHNSKGKLKYAVTAFMMISALSGCGMSSGLLMSQSNTIDYEISDNNIIALSDTIVSSNGNIDKCCDAEIILEEYGYKYTMGQNGNSIISNDKLSNCDLVSNGEDKITEEQVFSSWTEAQEYIDSAKMEWLYNEYLNDKADEVSIVISDKDTMVAKYKSEEISADIELNVVADENDDFFEFGKSYPSKLYNIRQDESKKWNIFSYKDYDNNENTSAVFADGELLIEIGINSCDDALIGEILKPYN